MQSHINDNSRPLIFLGSNWNMFQLTELAEDLGIKIHGILDSDYPESNTTKGGYPVLGSEDILNNKKTLAYYKKNFNFFCASNWSPIDHPGHKRTRDKRAKYISLIENNNLNCISLIDPSAKISRHAKIGRGVFIDAQVNVEPESIIEDFVRIYFLTVIGHGSRIGKNCTLQRRCITAAFLNIEEQSYFGPSVIALKESATIGAGSFVHECIYLKRGTVPGEIVSMESENQKRVYCL